MFVSRLRCQQVMSSTRTCLILCCKVRSLLFGRHPCKMLVELWLQLCQLLMKCLCLAFRLQAGACQGLQSSIVLGRLLLNGKQTMLSMQSIATVKPISQLPVREN